MVEWIERALDPLRGTLPADRFERPVSALTLLVGGEAMTVLHDTRAVEAEDVCAWAARAVLAAAQAPEPHPPDVGG